MDVALKQRLVGASVIIALAVIFIPMIFDDSNGNQNQSISIEIPQEPSNLQQKIITIDKTNDAPVVVEQVSDDSINIDAQPAVIETQETIMEIVDNTQPEAETVTAEVAEEVINPIASTTEPKVIEPEVAEPKVIEPEATEPVVIEDSNVSYRVKYGVFSQQQNAQQLKAKIIHNGLTALVEKDVTTGMYKVYSKSYSNKSSATKTQLQIKDFNLNIGKTSIEKLGQQALETTEMLLDTGWIVQVGIFSSRENAVKLRDDIRKQDFVSFVDEIINNNKKLYRLRVGPYAERSTAEDIKVRIKSKMNLDGLIKPHEKQKVIN